MLPVHIFAMFDRQDFDPAACRAVENAIRPNSVRPYLFFLKSTFEWFSFGRMVGKVAERFFDAFADSLIESLEILDGLAGEPDLLH